MLSERKLERRRGLSKETGQDEVASGLVGPCSQLDYPLEMFAPRREQQAHATSL